ncbi:hypothetical protein RRG08_050454 [Elysia crispata]|uniref:Uncharacterized protein n=1 Tax=Elysia crispata TaxID=231223 RepID=A0AAE1DJ78_9GAST|nr:hypothetical protein RRG08_050454 [Elysia crispata]
MLKVELPQILLSFTFGFLVLDHLVVGPFCERDSKSEQHHSLPILHRALERMSTTCLKRSVLVPVAKLASSSPVFLSSGNMAYLAPIVLCLVLAVETHAQGYYGGGYGYGRPEECTDVTRPCRMSLSLESDFGEPTLSSAHLCSCSHPSRCPTDLTQTDYVVSRRLVSSTYTTTLNMMFCNPVQPDRVCEGGETSVVLSGYLAIPDQLEVFNCSCEDGVPLQLNRRWRTANFKYMHEYVCDNQKVSYVVPTGTCGRDGSGGTRVL